MNRRVNRRMNYRVIVLSADGTESEGYGWFKLRRQAEHAMNQLAPAFPGQCVQVVNYQGWWKDNT
jgi:hypothetical protein